MKALALALAFCLAVWAGERPCAEVGIGQLKKSAAAGSPAAQKELADLLVEGRCVARDYAAALAWYRSSAEQNHHGAQSALGEMLAEGTGVPKNPVEGYMWIRLSAPPSDKHTREVLEKLARSMKREDVARAERNAVQWMRGHLENAQPAPK